MVYVISEAIHASNAFEVKETLYGLIDQAEGDLVLDLKHLNRIDSTGLGVLVSVYKRLRARDNQLLLQNVHENLMRVLKITMLDQIIEIKR